MTNLNFAVNRVYIPLHKSVGLQQLCIPSSSTKHLSSKESSDTALAIFSPRPREICRICHLPRLLPYRWRDTIEEHRKKISVTFNYSQPGVTLCTYRAMKKFTLLNSRLCNLARLKYVYTIERRYWNEECRRMTQSLKMFYE
jgi:hypothetical protein